MKLNLPLNQFMTSCTAYMEAATDEKPLRVARDAQVVVVKPCPAKMTTPIEHVVDYRGNRAKANKKIVDAFHAVHSDRPTPLRVVDHSGKPVTVVLQLCNVT